MCSAAPGISLLELHKSLGQPGYARFYHFIRQRNLSFSSAETKTVCKNCHTCAEVKPQFFKPASQTLIKAVRPWDRISVDFKRAQCPVLICICLLSLTNTPGFRLFFHLKI